MSGENGDRKDGFAWKPCGLHRTLWSRRPWDFHAIAPKGWLTPAPENGACRPEGTNLPRPRSVQAQRAKPSTATKRPCEATDEKLGAWLIS